MGEAARLWYTGSANQWNEALPIGNGRLGGMVFGAVENERIQLNEDSLWYGGPRDRNNPDSLANLSTVRELLFSGKIQEAEKLTQMAFTGLPETQRHYTPLGDLFITFPSQGEVEDYRRELDLNEGIVRVRYRSGGVSFTREVFSSYPDQVMVVRITGDKPGNVSFTTRLSRGRWRYLEQTGRLDETTIMMDGSAGGRGGPDFYVALRCINDGGRVRTLGEHLMVEQADSVTLLLAATTTFRHADTKAACLDTLSMVDKCSYDDLRKRHVEDYRILFDRVSFTLGEQDASDTQTLPTDERLERLRQGQHDLQLVSLYFQFARYLLIASSRPGTLPANLQGIWNEHFLPPWDSKYTININAQMNYWPAEVCNLPECHEPLFDLIERMREPGRHTAEVMYGCRGFTAHHNTDVWGDTAPQDSYLPASYWPLGVAWLCLHLWGHYAFSLDRDFLGKVYPTLKEAVLFFVDYLVEEPGGALVTCPSVSPENTYILPGGESGVLCFGSTMDTQIVRALFTACVEAVEILGVDSVFSAELKSMQQRLPATKVGKHGQIQEWFDDAGGITTPELVAAVSNAGGLGTLGAGYLTPEKLRTAIHSVKQLTDRPFGVNLFAPQEISFSTDEVQNMNQHLDQIRVHLGIEQGPPVETYAESFDDQIQVVLEEHVPVFSFTFGIPSGNVLRQLKDQGTVVIGTATTVNEALQLEVAGVDAIVVQGSEAGGHRGTFLTDANQALIGTMALIPQVVDQVTLPVIASGGIMDGRGMIASLALGASAVQMGTAFVTCAESGAHKLYKESILTNEEDATEVTFVYSGRAARGIRTKFMQWMNDYNGDIPPYPVQNALTRDIRNAAATQNNPEYMSLWAGQGLRLATSRTADAIIDDCVREALGILGKISSLDKV